VWGCRLRRHDRPEYTQLIPVRHTVYRHCFVYSVRGYLNVSVHEGEGGLFLRHVQIHRLEINAVYRGQFPLRSVIQSRYVMCLHSTARLPVVVLRCVHLCRAVLHTPPCKTRQPVPAAGCTGRARTGANCDPVRIAVMTARSREPLLPPKSIWPPLGKPSNIASRWSPICTSQCSSRLSCLVMLLTVRLFAPYILRAVIAVCTIYLMAEISLFCVSNMRKESRSESWALRLRASKPMTRVVTTSGNNPNSDTPCSVPVAPAALLPRP
jgi:hypothetical protein